MRKGQRPPGWRLTVTSAISNADERQIPFRQHKDVRDNRARIVPELPREGRRHRRADEEMNADERRQTQAGTHGISSHV